MPEWWSLASTERDGHIVFANLPREVNFLPSVLSAHDLESAGEEFQCTLFGAEESHLAAFDEVSRG